MQNVIFRCLFIFFAFYNLVCLHVLRHKLHLDMCRKSAQCKTEKLPYPASLRPLIRAVPGNTIFETVKSELNIEDFIHRLNTKMVL